MINRRLARVQITPELLVGVFHFPVGTQVRDAGWSKQGNIELVLEHDDLEELKEGAEEIPSATPIFKSNQPVEFVSWGQQK